MPIRELQIPQLGEGLREVLIQDLLKKPGDRVSRDEPIYLMETDKSVVDGQSPFDGVLREWLVQESDVVAVGSPIARIDTEAPESPPVVTPQAVASAAPTGNLPVASNTGNGPTITIPPRTRAYCRQLGVTEPEMLQIPAPTGKLLPGDVDRYLSAKPKPASAQVGQKHSEAETSHNYSDRPLSPQQRALIFRLSQSSRTVVPGTVARPINWQRLVDIARALGQRKVILHATEFQVFAYCVAQACRAHPKFRSTVLTNSTVREFQTVNLGMAVARPDDELITAVVAGADVLSLQEFLDAMKRQIRRAWREGDQVNSSTQVILSSLGAHGITDGVPTLVAPAVAVLFIGAAFELQQKLVARLALTFDHRLINGVGAARFIESIDSEVDRVFGQICPSEPSTA